MEVDESEEFISYGTALPEIEEEHVLRKKAARELEVRDEKGRQRFHGAFTGGFSAGYFNTVGTKEGWAPSTFVSSRDTKGSQQKYQKPEDFMDDEDFGEFGIATRKIHTTSQFQDTHNSDSNKRKFSAVDSVIPGEAPLKDIVQPVSESIGIKILNKLGWKLGQGIGPRVKKQSSEVKVYGCSLPNASMNQEDDPFSLSYTFAPEDVQTGTYKSKDDLFGLGYSGLSKDSVLTANLSVENPNTTKSWIKKDKKKLTISGQAFGVGAFEDDDDDIYSKDDMSQYDFSELKPIKTPQDFKNHGNKQDMGSMCVALAGFCLASEPPPVKESYPPPKLPHNYNPNRLNRQKVPETPTQPHTTAEFVPRHKMSADDRSLLLGEKKFQPFQINSSKLKTPESTLDRPPNKVASSSSLSFRPFPNDEEKQQRYEAYLKLKNTGELDKLQPPSSLTEWEKQQELEEFARAALLFRPLSAALSSRFESRSSLSVEHEVMDALEKAKKEKVTTARETRKLVGQHNHQKVEWHPTSLLCKRFNVANPYPNSDTSSAPQRTKFLFEHMTFPGEEPGNKEEPAKLSSPSEQGSHVNLSEAKSLGENITVEANKAVPIIEVANKNTVKNLEPPPTAIEATRPPIDFFKDIFENSSSEDEEAGGEESSKTDEPPPAAAEPPAASVDSSSPGGDPDRALATEDATSPMPKVIEMKKTGFGVFANLDLDALNQRVPKPKDEKPMSRWDQTARKEVVKVEEEKEVVAEDVVCLTPAPADPAELPVDLYGPELPPNFTVLDEEHSEKEITLCPEKRRKHKAKHKHKHHKHKSKKKKKKKSTQKSSDESSFDSDADIPHEVIIEKLKKLQKVLK